FGWIEKKDLQSNKLTRTRYNQSYPYIAQVVATKEYIETNGSRQLLNQQINTYRKKSLYNNRVHSLYLYQSQEKSYDFNSSNLLITVTTNQSNIDDYGNVGTISVTTKGNDNTFTKTTQNTYSNDNYKWHLGRLTKATVTHKAPNTPNITRTSSFTYNNKGLLSSETIAPQTNKSLTTTYEYDRFGNKTKSTTTGSGIVDGSSTTIKYSADGKFPIKTTNALGHFETKTFDAKTGNILTLTGPNGLSTTWKYDSLGRKTLERRADGTTTKVHYQWVENEPQDILYENGSPNSLYKNEPQNSLYQVTTTTSGSSPKTTYFDAFNRT
ncbi:hypothetical protein AZO1586R_130, partial [Bathymodiolus azoricus thioautotrophic gill symbiont]